MFDWVENTLLTYGNSWNKVNLEKHHDWHRFIYSSRRRNFEWKSNIRSWPSKQIQGQS